jgi:hypothetical protein
LDIIFSFRFTSNNKLVIGTIIVYSVFWRSVFDASISLYLYVSLFISLSHSVSLSLSLYLSFSFFISISIYLYLTIFINFSLFISPYLSFLKLSWCDLRGGALEPVFKQWFWSILKFWFFYPSKQPDSLLFVTYFREKKVKKNYSFTYKNAHSQIVQNF